MRAGMNNMNSTCKNEDVCWIENTNTKELNIYVGVLLLEKILQLSGATVRLQVTILYVQEVLTHFYSNHGSLIIWLKESLICAGKSCNMYYLITINHKFI